MHRWFLLVLIALLPLRGWVADGMAVQMLGQRTAAVAAAQHHAAGADCAQHAGMEAAGGHQQAAAHDDCPTCASCQACSAVVVLLGSSIAATLAFGTQPPLLEPRRFASAERAPAFKPPIS
jgi:hypothetical protein